MRSRTAELGSNSISANISCVIQTPPKARLIERTSDILVHQLALPIHNRMNEVYKPLMQGV